MKNPKKPTLAQKKLLRANGLVPENWLVLGENGPYLEIISRAEMERCQDSRNRKKPRVKYIGKE